MNRASRFCLLLLLLAAPARTQAPVAGVVETEADRRPRIQTHGDCFIRGGTLLTVTGGTIENGSILVRGGKIAGIGKGLAAPAGVPVIEAAGRFITPGIVDAHSHVSEEATNEGTDSVTPEVRIREVLDPNSRGIYEKLAAGFTSSLVLHGSANAIGGESVIIKLKYRHPVEDLPIPDAPRVVKFALGENVKSADGRRARFPNTRMGVEAVYRRAFGEARGYMADWDRYNRDGRSDPRAAPPRRDVRLEALADILRGTMWVHCHCYRADEMLMMLRLSKEFGFKLAVLQHALEAYKIAPEIAAAGVGVSTFSDAWAYKVEAYDAVPYNAALCLRAGILTSVNTDTSSGVTPLNLEAAKSMRFGGLTADEALRLITINPAKQLGIDHRTGSLEVGKDADIAIWDGHPLSAYSRCEMTILEGEVLFQRRDAFGLDGQCAAAAALPTACTADHLHLPLPAASDVYAITNATIHPVSGPVIAGGTVVIRKGRISAVGKQVSIPAGAVTVNGKGLHLYPGLIDAASQLGLNEIGQVAVTNDAAESGTFQPDMRALTAVNPASEHLGVTRVEGITAALTEPEFGGGFSGGGPLIGGQSAVIDLAGWTPELMKVKSPLALHIRYPEGPSTLPAFVRAFFPPEELKRQQDVAKEEVRKLKEELELGRRYAAAREQMADRTPMDTRLEAMIPYVTGRAPVVFQVEGAGGIKKVLELSEQLGLKPILVGASDAWRVSDLLAKRHVPVICSMPLVSLTDGGAGGHDYDPYDTPFAMPALLNRAGVSFCFGSRNAAMSKNVKFCGSVASAFGLPREAALRALTLDSAKILGVDKELGSIEPGKRADLIVTDGDPLEMSTALHYLFINGKPIPLESRHTRLYNQYRVRITRP